VLNYYPFVSTEETEKQQQTGLLLGSSEYSNRQQNVSARLRNLLQNLLLAKRTRPLSVHSHQPHPHSTLMSKTSGVAGDLYGRVVGGPARKSNRSFR
jgi:hypothetical protein